MKYSITSDGISRVEISVGELCFMAERSGDLEYRRSAERILSTQNGIYLHKLISESLCRDISEGEYKTEVELSVTDEYADAEYCISGRADGVKYSGGEITVDEYKTTGYEVTSASKLHLAQLKCYAYMLCKRDGLERIKARLIYCPVKDSGECSVSPESLPELKIFDQDLTYAELKRFWNTLLGKIAVRVKYADIRQRYVIPSAKDVPFPYKELREGQKELIAEEYRCIKRGKRLFVQAPTGIGKTISTLYPAVRALGDGLCDKIFYLTAKSSTRREAYNAAERLFAVGAHLRTIVLSSKNTMCLCEGVAENASSRLSNCDTSKCRYAKGYNNRVSLAIDELLSTQNCFTRGVIIQVAKKHGVCPYELSLDLSELCDLVICDYNYVFDPVVYLRRYFSENATADGRFVFLADEAHNLPERAREMYSSSLSCKTFENLYASLPSSETRLIKWFGEFIISMRKLRAGCKNELSKDAEGREFGFNLDRELNESFVGSVALLSERLDRWLRECAGNYFESTVKDIGFELHKFLKIAEIYDEAFLNYTEIGGGDIKFKLFCLDPSHPIEKCLKKSVSSVFFSATLTPPDYFADVLGRTQSKVTLTLPSPFPKNNLCITAVTNVSTRFEDRKKSVKKIAAIIAHTVRHRRGNYIVYFPSYAYMKDVLEVFSAKFPNVPLIVQKPSMSVSARNNFIDSFPEDTGKLRVGFCVLGGSFSEGIDLPGTRLIGTVIVGLGLPGLSNERNIIRDYFENKYERGYDYAYTYPGMNNVLQAAGRVIRRENDRGVVVLVDDRYETEQYKALYPRHWSHIKFAHSNEDLSFFIENFWKQN